MRANPEYLREHYHSLSDEALLAVDRSELVELAQQCYDAEMTIRDLAPRGRPRPIPRRSEDLPAEEADAGARPFDPEESAEWSDNAAEVYSVVVHPGPAAPDAVTTARGVLEAEGIPCYMELVEIPEEKTPYPQPRNLWRLMAPAPLNLQAMSTLSRALDNPEFEAVWKTELENRSDSELLEMRPEVVFCGLFDRIERVTRAYEEELAVRRRKP